jgi:hypothetical protein
MLRSFSPGWSTKLWAVCGVLAIVSLSLVLAAGCASGGSPTKLSGTAKVHTYNEAPAAEVAPRFFYGPSDDASTTGWDESRMVWSTTGTIPSAATGLIGLETAGAPTFTLSGNTSSTKYSQIKATADFYIVNNWTGVNAPDAITITGATIPEVDFVYAVPTGQDILDARLGGGATTMYQWLNSATVGYFQYAASNLFPQGDNTPAATVQTNFQNALTASGATDEVMHYPYITGLLPGHQHYPGGAPPVVTVPSETIPSGARSQGTGTVTFTFYGMNPDGQGRPRAEAAAAQVVALAFSTYFGVTVDFTYTP